MNSVPFRPPVMTDTVIDISHWQGEMINFPALRRSGIRAVFIKASQGTRYTDPRWAYNSYWAAQADLWFAPYHFVTGDSAAAQFDQVMRIANPGEGAVVMLDFEDNPAGSTADADIVAEIGQRLESVTGRAPLIYCGRHQIKEPHPVLAGWPLMLPQWGDNPVCPPGWTEWLFWQYTDKGQVRGITGAVDRSRFAGDHDDLAAWWMNAAPICPILRPAIAEIAKEVITPPAKRRRSKPGRDLDDPDYSAAALNRQELDRLLRQ